MAFEPQKTRASAPSSIQSANAPRSSSSLEREARAAPQASSARTTPSPAHLCAPSSSAPARDTHPKRPPPAVTHSHKPPTAASNHQLQSPESQFFLRSRLRSRLRQQARAKHSAHQPYRAHQPHNQMPKPASVAASHTPRQASSESSHPLASPAPSLVPPHTPAHRPAASAWPEQAPAAFHAHTSPYRCPRSNQKQPTYPLQATLRPQRRTQYRQSYPPHPLHESELLPLASNESPPLPRPASQIRVSPMPSHPHPAQHPE